MHSEHGRYWYSMSASLNRVAADRAGQIEEALVLVEIDKALAGYINGLADRGHFDAVQVAPGSSSDVPDEPGGVRAVVLGVAHPHTGREGSEALAEAGDILMQRGSAPRLYRNMLVFLAAERRQIDTLKDAMRLTLAWGGDRSRHRPSQPDAKRQRARRGEADGRQGDAGNPPEGSLVPSALSGSGKRAGGAGMDIGQSAGPGRIARAGEQKACP